MAIISGNVLFNTVNTLPTTGIAIATIPVVLRNTLTGVGLGVVTDSNGNFLFNNVPNGIYALVESFGTTIPLVTSPGDFTNAVTIPSPTPSDPPVSSVPSPPATTNAVESLSPNTINLTVSGSDITSQNFIDGPVSNISLSIADVTPFGPNLITAANNGNWGTLPAGSPTVDSPAFEPYPNIVPGFTYVRNSQNDPVAGFYSISNINVFNQFGNWFNFADHTSRDETGRYELVNGFNPGALAFTQNITVPANSYIFLTMWVMNVYNSIPPGVPPQLGAKLVNSSGSTVFNTIFTNVNQTSIPTWVEQGSLLFTGNNTSLTFDIFSNGPAANGNDYAIDDIVIQNVIVATIVNTTKSVSRSVATVGDNLTYTTVLTNTGQSTAVNISFSDTIPNGTTFVPNSVQINGITLPNIDPTPPGFTITVPSSLGPGSSITISFNVTVNTIPSPNPTVNSSVTKYDFAPIAGGATITQTLLSNNVSTQINAANLGNISKFVDKSFAACGDLLTYTINLNNTGNVTAVNVVLKDTIPNGTVFIPNSMTINGVSQPGSNISTGVTIPNIAPGSSSTVTFMVQISC